MRNLQHTLSWLFLIICGFFLALTSWGNLASGGDCGQPAPHQACAMADVVLQGRVLGIEISQPSANARRCYATITLQVSHTIKGSADNVVKITTSAPQQYGWFPFERGKEYIVFGNTLHNGCIYTSRYMGNMCVKSEQSGIELRQRIFEPGRFAHALDISVYQLQPINHKLGVGIVPSKGSGKDS